MTTPEEKEVKKFRKEIDATDPTGPVEAMIGWTAGICLVALMIGATTAIIVRFF